MDPKRVPGEAGADEIDNEVIEDDEADAGQHDEVLADDEHDDALETDDDDGSADSGEDDASGEDEGEGDRQDQVRAPSRREQRIIALNKKAKEEKERADRLESELQQLRAPRGKSAAEIAAEEAAERARLEIMPPEEQTRYLLGKQKQEFDAKLGVIQFQTADASDKAAFEAICARNPVADKYRDRVEETLNTIRRNGGNTTRETALAYIVGQDALRRAAGAKTRQTKRGAERVSNQQSRPSGGRSDVTRDRSRGGDERAQRAKRLENQSI